METDKQNIKIHAPEGWVVLRFEAPEDRPFYKVFATWRENDRWKVSSGAFDASEVTVDGEHVIWPQASGSTYKLPLGEENGYTFYQGRVMENIAKQSQAHGVRMMKVALRDVPGLSDEVKAKV